MERTKKWEEIKELFAECIEMPPGDRAAFLNERCGENAELRNEIETLLLAHADENNLLERHSIDLEGKVMDLEPELTERRFGKYRIVREIGSGGMGSVFLAERDDGEFSMHVALKIVRQSVASREVIERFRQERQILANLHHTNIATLIDGGVSDKNEPFLVMEFVDGSTITEYSDRENLNLKERLQLFLKVCSAVAFAHRNLVVHRDLKPSNILVDADGQPKLLDFGLAKAFTDDAAQTQTAFRAFTPAYASPEQILGGNISTASDQYSLGVILYELLTGAKPFNYDGRTYDEIVRSLQSTEVKSPSAAVVNGKRERITLSGDLDNITLKALRREPERRYGSVDAFADDIRRYLEGRPVTARANTFRYLASRFVKRYRTPVAAAALVLLALIGGFAAAVWQARIARQERDKAEQRFQDVRHLSNSLLFEISPKIERLPGSIDARELLVKRALEYLDSLSAESQNDPTLSAELAAAYEQVGDLQGNFDKPNLSDFAGALVSLAKARAIRESLPGDAGNEFRLAQNLRFSSTIRSRQNDVSGALADAERASRGFADLVLNAPESLEYRIASIGAEIEHGQIYSSNNRYADAIPRFRGAQIALNTMNSDERRIRLLIAKCHTFLGNALSWDGRQPEAESEIGAALTISDKLGSEFPNDSEIQASVWQNYSTASSVFEDSQKNYSLELARKALMIASKAAEADKADLQARHNLARAFSRVGILLAKLDKLPDAVTNLQSSERIFNELIEREPKNVLYQRDLGKLYVRMGDTSEMRRDVPDALLKFQNSAVIFEKIASSDERNTLALRDLAQSLRSVGKMELALSQVSSAKINLQRALEILERLRSQNALGGYDKQMIDDIEKTLGSI